MAAERNGIREYSRIRPFLTYIYLYGFLSREDFVELKISGPDEYDYCTRLLRTILPGISTAAFWQDGKKHLRFDRSYTVSSESQLADSYLLHTIKDDEPSELLHMLSCIARGGATQSQLQYAFSAASEDAQEDKTSTANRRRKELQDYGYIVKEKKVYRIKSSAIRALNDNAVQQLYDYVSFCAEVTYPRVTGSFLKRAIRRELLRRGLSVPVGSPFLLRHNDCGNIFDEDLVYRLQKAIEDRRAVEAHFRKDTRRIIPVALRADVRLGRWYLLYWDKKPRVSRIQNISEMKLLPKVSEDAWQRACSETDQVFRYTGLSGRTSRKSPYVVTVQLLFQDAPGMFNQFRRDIRMGQILREDGKDIYRVVINDPVELVPLLRQYSPWLKVLPGEHGLDAQLREDLKKMRQQTEESYGKPFSQISEPAVPV